MWKRGTARRNQQRKPGIADVALKLFSPSCRIIPSLALLLTILSFSVPAGAEQLIVRITLNQEEKGDFFINRSEHGDFLIKTADLKTMGFGSPSGAVSMLDGEPYLSLSSMKGVVYTFNEETLSLAVTATPSLLGKEIIDFGSKQVQKVYYPRDSSLFLNYGADYLAGDGSSFTSFNLTNQLGARAGDTLFLSDSIYTKDQSNNRFIRLQSSFTHDDRNNLRRFIAGDFFASSGDLGSNLNLGGISFAKIYRIDPYFINYPTLGIAGQASLPSEAKIYLNGMLLKTERISPGEFQLQNITPYGATGAVDVVLKDSFGREQKLIYPYYFAGASLLRKGLHEYSYNLGFMRNKYASESNCYGNLAFSAFHHYGVGDLLTLGFRAEARNNLYNLGPQATYRLGNFGLFSLSLAGSTGRSDNTGGAGMLTYVYQGLQLGASLSISGYTRDYASITTKPEDKPKTMISVGLSYYQKLLGTVSLGYTDNSKYVGQDSKTASVGYTRNLSGEATINATYRRVRETSNDNQFLITLNYTPRFEHFVSAAYQSTKDGESTTIQLQKNAPAGEGYGYSGILQKSDAGGQTTYTVNPSFQYNGRYGIYQGEFRGNSSSGKLDAQYHLATSGALVYAGNTFGVTRPVYDSFGLVSTGELKGVKVLLNSQEIGTTDSSGKLFIPNLGSFNQNQVAISDKEIPIDYYLSNIVKLISPPLRSGSCIPFVIKKIQPISGKLKIRIGGKLKPIEFQEIALALNGRIITFPTGSGGEFDIDLSQSEEFKKLIEPEESGCDSINGSTAMITPGVYKGTVEYEGKRYSFNLTIPEHADSIIDLGETIIDGNPPTL
jgi:outer membrane usher protein